MGLPPLSSSSLVFLSDQWSPHPTLAYVLFFCFIFYIIHLIRSPSSKNNQLPRQPPKVRGAWPLLGHIDLMALPFDKFCTLADKYGPIYRIQLGTQDTIIVNSWETLKECFTTNDKLFSNRPVPFVHKYHFNTDYSFNHIPYGSLWRDFRKIAAVALFSSTCLEMQRNIRTSEVNLWFNHLYMLWKKEERTSSGERAPAVSVQMSSWIKDVLFFVLFDIIMGADDDQQQNGGLSMKDTGKEYKKVLDDAIYLIETTFAISDLIPFLEWHDKLTGKTTALEKNSKEMDSFQEMWLQEYRRRDRSHRKSSGVIVDNNISDQDDQVIKPYMESLLSTIQNHPQFVGLDADVIIKTACKVCYSIDLRSAVAGPSLFCLQDMMLGGYQTITVALPWALFFLMNNRHVLDKARKELDETIGKKRQVEESDLKQLPYLQALMKETMRLYIPGADFLTRVPSEDCEVGGFHVKAGTNLILNLWKIHRDPNIWPEPLEFKPERFLVGSTNEGVGVKGQKSELVPFGIGRRMCPAVTFAIRLMQLVLARLIHGFELNIPKPDGTADTSAKASIPLTDAKMANLRLLISPRLDSEAYALKH